MRNKGAWSDSEDQLLSDAVITYGKLWKLISAEVFKGSRSNYQCKEHFGHLRNRVDPKFSESFGKAKKDNLRQVQATPTAPTTKELELVNFLKNEIKELTTPKTVM